MSAIWMDLRGCEAKLRTVFGDKAPAYVTLRRWAQQGILGEAKLEPTGSRRRTLYSVKLIERLVSSKVAIKKNSNAHTDTPPGKGGVALATASDPNVVERLDQLAASISVMVAYQERMEKTVQECVTAVQNLEGVRRTLMLKYDAQNASNVATIDELKSRLKKFDHADDNSRELALFRGQLSRLTDSVNAALIR